MNELDPNEAAKALAEDIRQLFLPFTMGRRKESVEAIILKHFQKFTEGMEKRVFELIGINATERTAFDERCAIADKLIDALRTERDQLAGQVKALRGVVKAAVKCVGAAIYTEDGIDGADGEKFLKRVKADGFQDIYEEAIGKDEGPDTALQAQLAKGGGE